MPLLILHETPAGYGLFNSKLKAKALVEKLASEVKCPESVVKKLTLKKFYPFENSAKAVEEIDTRNSGKVPSLLTSLLRDIEQEGNSSLAVCDMKLGKLLSRLPEFKIKTVIGSQYDELFRGIREHLGTLIPDISEAEMTSMAIGLGHAMARHKLKFNSSMVDTLLVHSSKLLEDLEKETNMFYMRLKEWYGWHFPEMAKIVDDHVSYARIVRRVGTRTKFATIDISDLVEDEVATRLKAAAVVSLGFDLSDEDMEAASRVADLVIRHAKTRTECISWVENRVQSIAPNLTALLGWVVASRLIAHVGTVLSLAKAPASTIQILGAEKALFGALKTKQNTPKYGFLFHTSLVGQANAKNKGTIARMLAAKSALAVRIDCLANDHGDKASGTFEGRSRIGQDMRIKIDRRLQFLEGKPLPSRGIGIGPDGQVLGPGQLHLKEKRRYNPDTDGVTPAKTPEILHFVDRSPDVKQPGGSAETKEPRATPSKSSQAKTEGKTSKSKKRLIEVVEESSEVDNSSHVPEIAQVEQQPDEPRRSKKRKAEKDSTSHSKKRRVEVVEEVTNSSKDDGVPAAKDVRNSKKHKAKGEIVVEDDADRKRRRKEKKAQRKTEI